MGADQAVQGGAAGAHPRRDVHRVGARRPQTVVGLQLAQQLVDEQRIAAGPGQDLPQARSRPPTDAVVDESLGHHRVHRRQLDSGVHLPQQQLELLGHREGPRRQDDRQRQGPARPDEPAQSGQGYGVGVVRVIDPGHQGTGGASLVDPIEDHLGRVLADRHRTGQLRQHGERLVAAPVVTDGAECDGPARRG